jgi:glycosyltransferase involved in cell wall biosynthesis
MAVRALPLAHALVERGHACCLVLPPWSHPQDSGRVFVDGGVQVANVALPPRLPGLFHLLTTWRLARAALAQRPDVIHCFKPKAYAGLAALVIWMLKRLGLARARLVVDSDDWEGRGGWNDIERYSRVQKAFFAWQEQWGLRHCDAVTVASRTLQSLAWSLGVSPAKVFYIPNGLWGVTTPVVAQPGRQESSHSTVLLYTRFFEFRVERAVQIVTGVLQAAPQAQVVVVGAGLFGEEKQFLARMQAAGLGERVTYAGWRDPAELPGYFEQADVAIYPFDDTLINRAKCAVKLIDLLSAGVPVVADRVGQNAEYIEHGVSGILVEPGDTTAFIAWVVRLLGDEAMRRSLAKNAQQRMAEIYTWTRLATAVEDAYR